MVYFSSGPPSPSVRNSSIRFNPWIPKFAIPQFPHLFAASIAVSIAASGYRFWLPFGKAKSHCSTILRDQNKLRDLGID
jgi:hypothetical protein